MFYIVMWLFAVFFAPIMLVLYLLTHREAVNRSAVVVGLFVGAFFCVFAILFGSGYRVHPASFLGIFYPVFLYEVLLPLVALTAGMMVFSKDALPVRATALMPAFLGFFCLFIPFRILFRSETLSGFTLFLKPVLLFSCVTGVACTVRLLVDQSGRGGQAVHADSGKGRHALAVGACICGVISAVTPAMAEACWYSGMSFALWSGLGALGICTTTFLLVCGHKAAA